MNDKAEPKYLSEILQLTPISSLSAVTQQQLIRLSETIMIPSGNSLFEQGENSERLFFLLSGDVELYQNKQFVKKISAGAAEGKTALNTSRAFSAVASNRIVLLMVDRALLERLVILDSCVDKTLTFERSKWIDQLLSSEVVARLPTANLLEFFNHFVEISAGKGDQIITQNMPGKSFYVIEEGSCAVTKHNFDSGDIFTLAELEVGGYFGEEALLSDQKRNTSVTMTSDGRLLRMVRPAYEVLLKSLTQNGLDYTAASAKVRDGAIWLDVRFEGEFLRSHIQGASNAPLDRLVTDTSTLSKDTVYILYCDLGLRSPYIANLLISKGFKVYFLHEGIHQYSRGVNMSESWLDGLAERLREDESEDTVVTELPINVSDINTSVDAQISAVDQKIRDLKSMLATESDLAHEWLGSESPSADLGILVEARKKMEHIDKISATSTQELTKSEGDSELSLLRKQLEGAQSQILQERERVGSNTESPEQKELTLKRVSDELETIKNRLKAQETHEQSRRESFELQLANERTKMQEELARFSSGMELQQSRSLEIEAVRQNAALETKQIIASFKKAHEQYRERQQKTIQLVRSQLKKQSIMVIDKARKAQKEKVQALASLRQVQQQLNDLRAERASSQSQASEVPLLVNIESMTHEIDKAKEKFHTADEALSKAQSEGKTHQHTLEQITSNENSVRNDFLDWFTSNNQFNVVRENLTSEQELKLERVKKIAHEALEQAFSGDRPKPDDPDEQVFKSI